MRQNGLSIKTFIFKFQAFSWLILERLDQTQVSKDKFIQKLSFWAHLNELSIRPIFSMFTTGKKLF